MRTGLLLFSLLLLIAAAVFYYLYDLAVVSRWRISAADARRQLGAGEFDLVLDVRTAAERATLGYYPGSVHVAASQLEQVVPARYPDKSTAILVYCNTGHRARLATDKLHALGYQNTRYISSSHLSLI